MAEGSFEYECMRAELLGIDPPDPEVFAQQQKLRIEAENDDIETEEVKQIDDDDETITSTAGKINELNAMLSVTQQKLNKFKRTCGSLTSLVKFRSTPTASASGSNENLADGRCDGNALNTALETLDTMQKAENQPTTIKPLKSKSVGMQKKVTTQIDKLDSMLAKTERASNTLQSQNEQMKKMIE